ncbi:MAG: long-chain fatty acid--CoA ligase [Myxococcota bacterium]
MSFVASIVGHLAASPHKPFITAMHGSNGHPTTGLQLLDLIGRGRGFLRANKVQAEDRIVLLAPNSADWVAADLAILCEAATVVPMYARQKTSELAAMMRDCEPALVICADDALADRVREEWADAPVHTFEAFFTADAIDEPPIEPPDDAAVTIIYTSGSTGEPKGVVSTVANVDYMLPQTATGLTRMMSLGAPLTGDDIVFHYLPFCFAGSRVVLWTCLYRNNGLHISTDLEDLAAELGAVRPNYFLNVPVLLERIKNGVEANLAERPAAIRWLYARAKQAWANQASGHATIADRAVLKLANAVLLSKIKERVGPRLRCLICGSAPLGEDTQRWFEMLGIPVYQVYGLTETTAIVTMDTPEGRVVPGRVGPALGGVEVRVGEGDEIQVRGPNIFPRYWKKPDASAAAFTEDGWFRTGDRGEVDGHGNWKIIGRVKNLLVPSSGHNVAPEPIEQLLIERIEGVEQALLVGHGKPFIAALLTGDIDPDTVQAGIDAINADLPHYKRVRAHHVAAEPFTIENGLLTANQKVRRDTIEAHYTAEIEAFYP